MTATRPGDHPQRFELINELHARPFPNIVPPTRVDHFAYHIGEGSAAPAHVHVAALCRRYGIDPPPADANHFWGDFGNFRLKWERHGEFFTLTVFRSGLASDPFTDALSRVVPDDWLSAVPGLLLVQSEVAVFAASDPPLPSRALLDHWFVADNLCGSVIGEGAVEIWTDHRLHANGASRLVICGWGVDPRRVGRLVQRLLEIETYRTLALLALPEARRIAPRLAMLEQEQAGLIAAIGTSGDPDADADLLHRLTAVAAALEELNASTHYRFSAAAAYFELVRTRLDILAEVPISGRQTIKEFLDRRLVPAMRTCQTMRTRLDDLHRRLARTANLLRTRIEIALEKQNSDLLASMNRRAELQLQLQETVEGLSVVAISYYALGLFSHVVEPLTELPNFPALGHVLSGAVPVILGLAWIVTRRIRARHRKAIEGE